MQNHLAVVQVSEAWNVVDFVGTEYERDRQVRMLFENGLRDPSRDIDRDAFIRTGRHGRSRVDHHEMTGSQTCVRQT